MNNLTVDDLLNTLKERDEEIKKLYDEIHEFQKANLNLCKSYNDVKHEIAMHVFSNLQKLKNT